MNDASPGRAPAPPASAATPVRERPHGGAAPRSGKLRRGGRIVAVLSFLFIVAAAAGAWWYLRGGDDGVAQLVTVPVTRGDVEDAVTALGTLQPSDYVDVGTQVSGQLRKIHVDIGAEVKEGALLAEIDPTVYQTRVEGDKAQLRNLQAQLAENQAQRRLAQQQFARQTGLLKANATSQDAYQSAEAALKVAEAQIEALKAQIDQTQSTLRGDEANLGYTKIYAPKTGSVVSVTAKQGQTLNANQQAPIILRIADLDTMTVWTQVSEADVGRLEIGMDAYFTTLGQPERRWTGKLRQILPTPDVVNNVVLYNALFDVENQEQALKTQMTAQVFFVRAAARGVLNVPLAALQPGAGGNRQGVRSSGQASGGSDRGGRSSSGDGRGADRAGSTAAAPRAPEADPPPAGESPGGAQRGPRQGDDGSRGRHETVRVMKDGTVEERQVIVGVRNRVAAEIRSGLDEGELVVVGTRQRERAAPQAGPRRQPRI